MYHKNKIRTGIMDKKRKTRFGLILSILGAVAFKIMGIFTIIISLPIDRHLNKKAYIVHRNVPFLIGLDIFKQNGLKMHFEQHRLNVKK